MFRSMRILAERIGSKSEIRSRWTRRRNRFGPKNAHEGVPGNSIARNPISGGAHVLSYHSSIGPKNANEGVPGNSITRNRFLGAPVCYHITAVLYFRRGGARRRVRVSPSARSLVFFCQGLLLEQPVSFTRVAVVRDLARGGGEERVLKKGRTPTQKRPEG